MRSIVGHLLLKSILFYMKVPRPRISTVLLLSGLRCNTDMKSGYKYPELPGTLSYWETGGSNQDEVQIWVVEPCQHPHPSIITASVVGLYPTKTGAKII